MTLATKHTTQNLFTMMLRIAVSLLLAIIFSLYPRELVVAGTVEGIVFSEDGPAANARVFAYSSYEDLVANRAASQSETGSKIGHYNLQLKPGTYYLLARAQLKDKQLFSYHGVNPISISDCYRWLPFLLVEDTPNFCDASSQQGLSGQVTYKGQPVNGGVVSIYPLQDGKFRGMGLLTNTLDDKGRFFFALEPGNYVLIARKKQEVRGIGPVKQGDMFCYPSANPITLQEGQQCTMQVNCYPRDNLDLFLDEGAVNPQGQRHDTRRQASLYDLQPAEPSTPVVSTPTSISGKITDQSGQARPGLVVTAYPANGLDLFQMHIVRLITNDIGQSDQEGRFSIKLEKGGKYYIVAREKMGEAPDRGEYYGLYEGAENHAISVVKGENLSGIDVVVERIMPNALTTQDNFSK